MLFYNHTKNKEFGGPKAHESLDESEVKIHEGKDRDNLSVKFAPEMSDVGISNTDEDSDLETFESKHDAKSGNEYIPIEEIGYDPTEDIENAIDNPEQEEDEGPDELIAQKEWPEEMREINRKYHWTIGADSKEHIEEMKRKRQEAINGLFVKNKKKAA